MNIKVPALVLASLFLVAACSDDDDDGTIDDGDTVVIDEPTGDGVVTVPGAGSTATTMPAGTTMPAAPTTPAP